MGIFLRPHYNAQIQSEFSQKLRTTVKAELFQLAHFVKRERTLPALTIPENHVYCLVNG